MAKYRASLPQLAEEIFVCYAGMDTDLIFNRGIDLPGFASYPLLESNQGRAILREYYVQLLELGRVHGVGVILDSVTWVANRDRGATLGYSPKDLRRFNVDAIELIAGVRDEKGDLPTVLSAQVGPRGDGYAPTDRMSVAEAEDYHAEQIEVYAKTEADLVSAFTLCYAEEAAGIVRAARRWDLPVAIAFTVGTDGRLPTGMPLKEAVEQVDEAGDGNAAYFLVNCAHPDHFSDALNEGAWMQRLRGVVVNASRRSHAELDNAEELDAGDPDDLGRLVGGLRRRHPRLNILGGCCGSDMRHMKRILKEAQPTSQR